MSLQLLEETIIFGNLDICYTNQMKKEILEKIPDLIKSLEENFPFGDESAPWRFMGNLSFIVDSCESWIINKKDQFSRIIYFLNDFIEICIRKMGITNFETPENVFKIFE
mgnify:CR=1 FL=1